MPMRDGAGSFEINNPDDGTAIKEMLSFRKRMLLITEKCTYEVQLADQIDPGRTNPDLPHNVQRKLFDLGITSDALCKTLLQANMLFKDGFLPIDLDAAKALAMQALIEFASMKRVATEFKDLERIEIEKYQRAKQQARSVFIPSIGGIDGHCKTFAQKAHYFGRALISLARLFVKGVSNWDEVKEAVRARYGDSDVLSKLLNEIIPQVKLVLHLRDALEHQNKSVTVKDFTIEQDGTISPPTVELNFRGSALPRCSVSSLMEGLLEALPIYFEMTMVNLCSKFAQPVAGLSTFITLLPDEFQKARHVRFGYWCRMPNGDTMPFG
jgi:hypothetical protein